MIENHKRKRKCKICGESYKEYGIIRDKVFCKEHYLQQYNKVVKCSICNKEILLGEALGEKTKYYCSNDCLQKYLLESKHKEELYKYLVEINGVKDKKQLNRLIFIQIGKYVKDYNYTYKGMYLTLKYIREQENKQINDGTIGIIPYYYTKAKDFFIKQQKIILQAKQTDTAIKSTKITIIKKVNKTRDKRIDKLLILPEEIVN